jgi:hypothetical protein
MRYLRIYSTLTISLLCLSAGAALAQGIKELPTPAPVPAAPGPSLTLAQTTPSATNTEQVAANTTSQSPMIFNLPPIFNPVLIPTDQNQQFFKKELPGKNKVTGLALQSDTLPTIDNSDLLASGTERKPVDKNSTDKDSRKSQDASKANNEPM